MTRRIGTRVRVVVAAALLLTVTGSARADAGPTGGALPPQLVQVIQVGGANGIPVDAAMVAANVTAINPAAPGYLTVYACDEPQPTASNVNYLADQIVPNLVLSRVAADGTICIATLAVTDLFVDLVGYVPDGSSLTPLAVPVRALDTRGPAGDQPLVPAGGVLEIPIAGRHGVASDATVVMFNATAIAGDQPGYLTAYPCGTPPTTSSVNYLPGQIVPNLVTARLSATGALCISTLAPAHVIVDVAAYATEGIETLATPQRIFDSRTTTGVLAAGTATSIDIAGRTDVPDDATAAVYNLTSVDATAPGYATSYPCDAPVRPEASNLNYGPGAVVANGAITKLSSGGALCIYNLAPTNLIVDLTGYTQGPAQYVPITPVRVVDTREGWLATCDVAIVRRFDLWGVARPDAGALRPIDIPIEIPENSVRLMPDCRNAVMLQDDTLFTVPLDGSPRQLLRTLPVAAVSLVRVLDDGRVIGISYENSLPVVDLTNDVPFVPTLWSSGTYQETQVTLDGAIAAQPQRAGDQFVLDLFDVAAGNPLSSIGPFAGRPFLSPNGTYVAWAEESATSRTTTVTTLAGEVVARLPFRAVGWAGEGALLLKVQQSLDPFGVITESDLVGIAPVFGDGSYLATLDEPFSTPAVWVDYR